MKINGKKVTGIIRDCKDESSVIEDLIKIMKKNGINVYPIPSCDGTDMIGYFVSNDKLTKQEIKELDIPDED